MKKLVIPLCILAIASLAVPAVGRDDAVLPDVRARLLEEDYGLTGRGVTIAILDRGIDWDHPDFIRPDGTTRIRWLLDMTGQNWCDANNPGLAPVEYSASQINDALGGGAGIDSRDAVGHGTVTAGIAAGNGSAFAEGKGDLYFQSSGGPTRDGRLGVDITAAGHNVFAALAQNSIWATGRWNMVQDGGGWYVRGGATSGAAPVVVGAVALMLELKPDLTADQVRAILRDTAVSDTATGTTPNPDWGFGKLNLSSAIGAVQRLFDVPDRGGFTQAADPPYHGTVWIDPDIITSSDPTAFQDIIAAGRGERTMYDRRVSGWITVNAYLFNAQFDDGLTAEIQVNPEFGSASAAMVEANKYGRVIGQLPTVLRTDVETVWIHKGNHPLGGGNDNILIHVDRAENSKKKGFLEEELVHEGAHTSLDSTHSEAPDWIAAQKADSNYISTYARDYPKREDIAESFLSYLAVRYRSARVSPFYEQTILKTIPNRIAYFDAQSFDDAMYPVIADLRLPQTLKKVSGDNQQDASGAALADPLVVEVRNQNGTVLEGIQVRFAVASGGGQLSVETTMTDSSGRAASALTLGSSPGTNTVAVTVSGTDRSETFVAEALATPDFDGDGTVGFADFLQFAAQFGLSQGDAGYEARYDLDGDGTIGFGDFLIFANAFGK